MPVGRPDGLKSLDYPSAFTVYNTTLTLANTEYSFIFPSNTYGFDVQPRNSGHTLRMSHVTGQVAGADGTHFTVSALSREHVRITQDNLTIYFGSPNAGCVVEIIVWT
jgi:hypothetical protein